MVTPTPLNRDTDRIGADEEVLALRAEVERLRALVGPSEESYDKLRLDVLGARDAAKAAEAELGVARSKLLVAMAERDRYEREFLWFRHMIVSRILGLRRYVPTIRNVSRRLGSR